MGLYPKLNRPIHVVDYDPSWPSLYEAERAQIQAALGQGAFQIEHIGSTSVPGLPAKPVIDIAIGVENLKQGMVYRPALESLGYTYVPELDEEKAIRRFFWKGTPLLHTYHISMEEVTGTSWNEHLLFRDYLRAHPEAASRYQALKRELALRCVDNMEAYVGGKTDFIYSCLEKS
jgi:GrpB-like predicted nucleotidyltransferase (UPF0157 family)